MKLEGDLHQIDLVPHLLELAETRFTGAIRFEHEGVIKILYFKDGDVLSASTNDRNDSVDEILLRAGKISRDHTRQALGKRKENETLGDVLLSLGFIAKKELLWARRAQIVGIIRSIGSWPEGTFQIVQDYLPKREEGTLFYLPQIILEMIVTEPDRSSVERDIGDGSAVLRKAPGFPERYARLALNEDADAITSKIDGSASAAEIAAATGLETFAVYKLLAALRTLGLLRGGHEPKVIPEVSSEWGELDEGSSEGSVTPSAAPSPLEMTLAGSFAAEEETSIPPETYALDPLDVPLAPAYDPVQPSEVPPPPAPKGTGRKALLLALLILGLLLLGGWAAWRWLWGSGEVPAAVASEPRAQPAEPDPSVPADLVETDPEPQPSDVIQEPEPPELETPVPTATATVAPVEAGGDAMRQRYALMADSFARQGRETAWAVQFSIVCQTESVTRALAAGENVWFIPIRYREQPCFRMFWGRYATREAAERGVGEVPAFLRGSGPVVVRPQEILR